MQRAAAEVRRGEVSLPHSDAPALQMGSGQLDDSSWHPTGDGREQTKGSNSVQHLEVTGDAGANGGAINSKASHAAE